MAAQKSNLNDLIKSPEAAGLLKNKDAIAGLMNSPDTQKLMELLNQNAGGGLKNAADAAMHGNTGELVSLIDQIMKSKEGAGLVDRINKSIPQK